MKDLTLFGKYVQEAAKAASEIILEEDVPKFLGLPHPMLAQDSPLGVIWRHGRHGLDEVLRIIESIKSGSFS